MGVAGEDRVEIFQDRGEGVQFLHKNKLKSEIFNEKKKFINKNFFLCQFKLRI